MYNLQRSNSGYFAKRLCDAPEPLEKAVEDLSEKIWLSPAVVAEILKRAREAIK